MLIRVFLPIAVLIIPLIVANLFLILDSITVHFSQLEKSEQANQVEYNKLHEQKTALLKENDIIQLNWLRTLNPRVKDVHGRVIWSTNKQSGVMVIRGLPKPNTTENYQLWIYDLEKHFNKPVPASIQRNSFAFKNGNGQPLIIPFQTDQTLEMPYKFELVLERKTNDVDQNKNVTKLSPLLLAQP